MASYQFGLRTGLWDRGRDSRGETRDERLVENEDNQESRRCSQQLYRSLGSHAIPHAMPCHTTATPTIQWRNVVHWGMISISSPLSLPWLSPPPRWWSILVRPYNSFISATTDARRCAGRSRGRIQDRYSGILTDIEFDIQSPNAQWAKGRGFRKTASTYIHALVWPLCILRLDTSLQIYPKGISFLI